MNLLLLLIGMRPWRAQSARERLTRIFVAIGVFSLEMQAVTVFGLGSMYSLRAANAVVAAAIFLRWPPAPVPADGHIVPMRRAVPVVAWGGMALLVLALNLGLPLTSADEYHLQKIAYIQSTGTLAYNPAVSEKVNVVGSLYELVLADLGALPGIGEAALRLHGLWGLLLMLAGIAAARELLDGGQARLEPAAATGRHDWMWSAVLLVPALFHQFVLVKNDLFVAAPALAVLAWVLVRVRSAPLHEVGWAAWLTGVVVATKLTSLPLAVILGVGVLWSRPRDWRALGMVLAGGAAGALTGGLSFALGENLRVYGDIMPVSDQGNVSRSVGEAFANLGRFALSLFDLGQLTPRWWPGRGGWGSTFGLPFIWAIVVLASAWRRERLARAALVAGALYFVMFALVFQDADLAHRIALAPGLLLVLTAVTVIPADATRLRTALAVALGLSAAQVLRSAATYFMQ